MPREDPLLRVQIEQINRRFPQVELLTVQQAAELLGRGKSYIYQHYGEAISHGRIPKTRLAALILRED